MVGEGGGDWTCLSGETLAHKLSSKFSLVCLVYCFDFRVDLPEWRDTSS
jgi:hypothetical protein